MRAQLIRLGDRKEENNYVRPIRASCLFRVLLVRLLKKLAFLDVTCFGRVLSLSSCVCGCVWVERTLVVEVIRCSLPVVDLKG